MRFIKLEVFMRLNNMKKMKFSNFNDGYMHVYNEKPVYTDFKAKKNIKSIDNLEFIVTLAYEECSKRQQDLDFAESHNKTLNLKIKTRLFNGLNSNQKIVILDELYDIIYIDSDRKKTRDVFLFREGEKNC